MSERAPTSTPRVGSSRTTTRGSSCRQRAMTTFCALPPARLAPAAGRPRAPAGGLGGGDDARLVLQAAGDDDLLRVAAGQAAHRRADARAADAVAGDRGAGARPPPPPARAAGHPAV